jgi:S1-C subfamily serine protease
MRRLIASKELKNFHLVPWQDNSAIEQYAWLSTVLAERCGSAAARLFAEPSLQRGNGATTARVDWYVSSDVVPVRWSELTLEGQALLRERLKVVLGTLRPLLYDAEIGPLLAACLNLASRDALAVLGEQPLLLDWGMLPTDVQDGAARSAHNNSILGVFDGISPTVDRNEWASRYGGSQSGARHNPLPNAAPILRRNVAHASWRAPAAACTIAALVLLLSFVPNVLAFQGPPVLGADPAVREGLIAGLRARLDRLGSAMTLDCFALKSQSPALLPVAPASLSPGAAATPPAEGTVAEPGRARVGTTNQADMVTRLERGVVLVVAGEKLGSGFFVSSELIVTNRHVASGRVNIIVAGKQVGVISAVVVAEGNGDPLNDFALLRVAPQSTIEAFTLALPVRPMESVVSAGFPGLYMATDPSFQRLKRGDASAAADLAPVFQAGVVNHLQRYAEDGVTLVVHSAEIAPGNSGGPLVDACSRVLGVNTFDRSASDRAAIRARYALGSDGLSAFLASAGLDLKPEQGACVSEVSSETIRTPPARPSLNSATPAP